MTKKKLDDTREMSPMGRDSNNPKMPAGKGDKSNSKTGMKPTDQLDDSCCCTDDEQSEEDARVKMHHNPSKEKKVEQPTPQDV